MPDLLYKLIPVFASVISMAALLFVTLRYRSLAATLESQSKSGDTAVAALECQVTSLAGRVARVEAEDHETPVAPQPVLLRAGMNLNKRTQALRQYRLGQGPGEIARSLDMPKAEIDLLVKVQKIVSQTLGA